jgi:hypothetical protein
MVMGFIIYAPHKYYQDYYSKQDEMSGAPAYKVLVEKSRGQGQHEDMTTV